MMQGTDLRELRAIVGMTQAKFADALGVSRKTVNDIENSPGPIDTRTMLAARFLADRYSVCPTPKGYAVVRRTIKSVPRELAMAQIHGQTVLYGLFDRRDHAYRWVAALREAEEPRATRRVLRERGWGKAESEA